MKELLDRGDPALLTSTANGVAEAALTIRRSLCQPFPLGSTSQCVTSPREQDSIEKTSSLTFVADREKQEDVKRKAHNICPLLEARLVPEGVKKKRVTWKVPLESWEPVATKPEEKKKQRKKWYPRSTLDCSLGNYKDPMDGQREGGGAWLGLKTLRFKRAKQGKTNGSHAGFRWRRPGRFSPFQSPRGPHRCKLCGKAFYCVLTLLKHAQTHSQDAGCVCVVCGKHSESREGLLQHLQTHKENFKTF